MKSLGFCFKMTAMLFMVSLHSAILDENFSLFANFIFSLPLVDFLALRSHFIRNRILQSVFDVTFVRALQSLLIDEEP